MPKRFGMRLSALDDMVGGAHDAKVHMDRPDDFLVTK